MAIVPDSLSRSSRGPDGAYRATAAAVAMAAFGLAVTPASAQVAAITNGGLNLDGKNSTCANADGTLYVVNGDDCDPGGPLTGADPSQYHFLRGIGFGSGNSASAINADGSATFGGPAEFTGGATFNSGVQFNGQVNLGGFTQAQQLNSTSINNSGPLSSGSINTGSLNVNGRGRFTGGLSSDTFSSNLAQLTELEVGVKSTFRSSVQISGQLAFTPGTAVDAGGNRIQNVGAPVDGTDAANKDYVDTALANVQGNVTALSNTVADHETRITAVETQNVQQDNRLTAVENINTVQDNRLTSVENVNTVQDGRLTTVESTNVVQNTRLGAVETENVTQNTRLTSIENVNIAQDSRMTAIESVNTMQTNQISTLQDQVGGLQASVGGLRRNIQEANGGIAAAVALGGTMVVPDSDVSMSFNLATYRGQQGFSGAIVGRVAPKVYVNAGVGASTVRRSTAGRVGISFGL
jgi:hypothetical protein